MKKGAPVQAEKVELIYIPSLGISEIVKEFKGSIEFAKFIIDDVMVRFDTEV